MPLEELDMDRVMRAYGDGVLRLCFLYLRERAAAEDAAQETFVRAWRGCEQFDGRSSLKTWITGIAVNVCRNQLRSPWRRRRVDWETLEDCAAPDRTETDDTVTRAVLALPAKYREAVVLYYYQGLSTAEMAAALRLPAGTVSTRLRRARERLMPMLKEWYYDEA